MNPPSESRGVPAPGVMPCDREQWRAEIHRSNFVNTYCQYRDVQSCGQVRKVLVVGPGQGLDTAVLRWAGYDVTTFDIDETFQPDVIGSVHDLSMFADRQFDVVTASHVLEHMAVPYLDPALAELARVARYAIVYLPVHGRRIHIRVAPGFRDLDISFVVEIFNYWHKPDGMTPRYAGGQHFWELGMRGFRRRDLLARMAPHFEVLRHYRNPDWPISYNFVLRSRRTA
jgi:predicted SAM-dependent methyltransferase